MGRNKNDIKMNESIIIITTIPIIQYNVGKGQNIAIHN